MGGLERRQPWERCLLSETGGGGQLSPAPLSGMPSLNEMGGRVASARPAHPRLPGPPGAAHCCPSLRGSPTSISLTSLWWGLAGWEQHLLCGAEDSSGSTEMRPCRDRPPAPEATSMPWPRKHVP